MRDEPITTLSSLNSTQKSWLTKAKITTTHELILWPPDKLSQRCKISTKEAQSILEAVAASQPFDILPLQEAATRYGAEIWTTGDASLDEALGGGLRTGMVWEVVGESAAGKTQFALQSSLFVQLPRGLGGIAANTCYLTTSVELQTSRLLQMLKSNPSLKGSSCTLDHIHTLKIPTVDILIEVLSKTLPTFLSTKQKTGARPVKLVVIDALAELFHSSQRLQTSTMSLVERSQSLIEISTCLHSLASTWNLAILVLNEVVDVFLDNVPSNDTSVIEQHMLYRDQSSIFGRVDGDRKEASLGLAWANQVNARIMLSRTGRRRHVQPAQSNPGKQQKTGEQPVLARDDSSEPELIRRLSVLFSNVSQPVSLDYVVRDAGIMSVPDSTTNLQ